MAKGICGDSSKVCIIDTEGRRALMYADDPDVGGFNHIDFRPPYSSLRFKEAIEAATNQGAEVVIIDSASHEHEGDGGLLDFATREEARMTGNYKNRNKWIKPKRDHNKFMNHMRGSRAWIICCIREKTIIDMDVKPAVEKLVPVCNSDLLFDMTLTVRLEPGTHKATFSKVPKPMKDAVSNGQLITKEHGFRLFQAVNTSASGEKIEEQDPIVQTIIENGEAAARSGGKAYIDWAKALDPKYHPHLAPHKARLSELARQEDERQSTEDQGQREDSTENPDPVDGRGG